MNKSSLLFGLQQKTAELLIEQISMEHQASAQYLTIASWCDVNGYEGSAKFFYKQADEERNHMLKLMKFLTKADLKIVHPGIKNLITDFKSLKQIFEFMMKYESTVTSSIHSIANHCFMNKDFSTLNFMQWYIIEQIEEEANAQKILNLFEIIKEEGIGLYTIDKAIGEMA